MIPNYKFTILLIFLSAVYSTAAQRPHQWFEVRNCTEVNTAADEFAPVMHPRENLLYYNSTHTGRSRFYTAAVTTEIEFLKTGEAKGELHPRRSNYSYITFDNNGEAYLSAFRQTERNSVLNIFKSTFKNDSWLAPQPVSELAEDDFTAHPALSRDGKFIIFSSSKPGGHGGTDLWIARRRDNGTWQEAVNLGEILNSIHDEITPFIAGNDTLFFASNGFGGKGGFEMFMSVLEGGVWQPPVALSELNTPANESDFALINSHTAIYASDKPGGKGGFDLYVAQASNRRVPDKETEIELSIKASVENVIITSEARDSTLIPLIPYIFFKSGSAELPAEFLKNSVGSTTPENSNTTVSGYANLLNIIGARLGQFPEAKLVIEGWSIEGASGTSTTALSRERVRAVADFLKTQWNVSDDRLNLGFHEMPRSVGQQRPENRRVELSSDDSRIFEPLIVSAALRSIQPETLFIEADARPRDVVEKWSLLVNGKEIPGMNTQTELPAHIAVSLLSLPGELEKQSLLFTLDATDTAGMISQKYLDVNIQHVSVKPGQTSGPVHHSVLFYLKTSEIYDNAAVTALVKQFSAFKRNTTVTVRHTGTGESKLRAELLLKELSTANNGLVTFQLKEVETIPELPESLIPLAGYAVGLLIEESI